ncbi:MAG: nicotinamide riboside transporter PnuC [Lachnospiraceae bacterium]|nr:nicotinamide riboside transporter PnuC [Lachnospiraceae bacterium]
MNNPLKSISKKEWIIWICSVLTIAISNLVIGDVDFLMLLAAWVGVTSLILAAKGNVWAQILMVLFSVLYAIISWKFRYWGEMITYLGMTLPMAIWSTVTWIKNPSESGKEVAIQALTKKHVIVLLISGSIVTVIFFYMLQLLNTPNIAFSTISILTSFFAAVLTMLRSSYYALGYAANDLVLIFLWIMASSENPVYVPVVINFIIFFFYDMYGFLCWKNRELNFN